MNTARPGTSSLCPTRSCVSTNWKTCRTKSRNCSPLRRKVQRSTSSCDSFSMTTETSAINYKIGNERLIRVTDNAARKLASLLEEKGKPNGALRRAVIGGGCSGLQYTMDLVDGPKERDILVPTSNVQLVVDPKSALFVSGSVLDYSEDLQKGGFKVTNPNAVAHCSCGERFAVCPLSSSFPPPPSAFRSILRLR